MERRANKELFLAMEMVKAHCKVESLTAEEAVDEVKDMLEYFLVSREKREHFHPSAPTGTDSIGENEVVCLICGEKRKVINKHLRKEHSMSASEYKEQFNIPQTVKLTAKSYSETRRDLAKTLGLGRKKTIVPIYVPEPVMVAPPAPLEVPVLEAVRKHINRKRVNHQQAQSLSN